MKLSEDYDDQNRMTKTMVAAIVFVGLFVFLIIAVVWFMNRRANIQTINHTVKAVDSAHIVADGNEKESHMLTEEKLTPNDFDFWDMYPQEEKKVEENDAKNVVYKESLEKDPSADGKHTLIEYLNGEQEWVLISPFLLKHEYDFTNLLSQSNLMKYYLDNKLVSYVGVDISKSQDYIDFIKLKKAGIEFVMIRVGARGYGTGQLIIDDYFGENIKRATDAGLKIGLYFSSQAITEAEAIEEADLVLESIGDYKVSYPIAFMMELIENDTARIDGLSRNDKTVIAKAFLNRIEEADYIPMLYGNKEWLIKQIDMSKLTTYDVWLAQYKDLPDYPYQFTMWRYTNSAIIDGISGYTNLNISFIDYSEK